VRDDGIFTLARPLDFCVEDSTERLKARSGCFAAIDDMRRRSKRACIELRVEDGDDAIHEPVFRPLSRGHEALMISPTEIRFVDVCFREVFGEEKLAKAHGLGRVDVSACALMNWFRPAVMASFAMHNRCREVV